MNVSNEYKLDKDKEFSSISNLEENIDEKIVKAILENERYKLKVLEILDTFDDSLLEVKRIKEKLNDTGKISFNDLLYLFYVSNKIEIKSSIIDLIRSSNSFLEEQDIAKLLDFFHKIYFHKVSLYEIIELYKFFELDDKYKYLFDLTYSDAGKLPARYYIVLKKAIQRAQESGKESIFLSNYITLLKGINIENYTIKEIIPFFPLMDMNPNLFTILRNFFGFNKDKIIQYRKVFHNNEEEAAKNLSIFIASSVKKEKIFEKYIPIITNLKNDDLIAIFSQVPLTDENLEKSMDDLLKLPLSMKKDIIIRDIVRKLSISDNKKEKGFLNKLFSKFKK